MKKPRQSITLWGIVTMFVPALGVAVANPTPETIGAAVVATVGAVLGVYGRIRAGGIILK